MKNQLLKLLLLFSLSLLPIYSFARDTENWIKPLSHVNSGDTAFILICSVLVLLMTVPGIALFYGGMSRKKNVLNTMMMSFSAACTACVLWVILGYSLAFTPNNAVIGGLDRVFLLGMNLDLNKQTTSFYGGDSTVPEAAFMFFQMTFITISTAIMTGSFVGRMKFSATIVLSALWSMFVYVPICHWVWGGGFMSHHGVMDFAGGTVVHITAGVSGLTTALFIGKRMGYGKVPMTPHNMVLTLIGAAFLWLGWFGFNAGSAGAANASAAMAAAVTQVSTASGALSWLLCEKIAKQKPSALGLASGAVAGLVGITPAAGFVGIPAALLIGLLTAAAAYFSSVILKRKLGYDDSLDAFGIHGFGGIIGSILTGLLFSNEIFGGNATVFKQVFIQLSDGLVAIVYSALMTLILLFITRFICGGLRVSEEDEYRGLDLSQHGEKVE
ncbi:MAG: ammonium transporter [Neisseriaceae bacterium]|nr:ammonium transporter [Neisseriaceae bacterium]